MAAKYLGSKYAELKQAARGGDVIYMDETGWLVKGEKAWMWIMATEDQKDNRGKVTETGITVYVAALSSILCKRPFLPWITNRRKNHLVK